MSLNDFDAICYINLDHREDRKEHLLQQLNDYKVDPKKIVRIPAVYNELNGHKGCVQSHMLALLQAMDNKWDKTLILEDDAFFTKDPSQTIFSFFKLLDNNWDIFFLGTNVRSYEPTTYPNIYKVTDSLCAHAYAVNSHYLEKLYSCYHVAFDLMKDDLLAIQSLPKALDRVWHLLQKEDRWFILDNVAQQGESYSDICMKVRNRWHKETFESNH